jgi:hypothetical protein
MRQSKYPDRFNAVIRADAKKFGKRICKLGRRMTKARRMGRLPF